MMTTMNHTFKALLFFTLTAGLAAEAQAQLVKYQFTGTSIYGNAGSTIAGEITLDVGASPSYCADYPGYYNYAAWQNGNFAIDAITDTGIAIGTNTDPGGYTQFYSFEYDPSNYLFHQDYIYYQYYDGNVYYYIDIYTNSYSAGDGNVCEVPDPWDPLAAEYARAYIQVYDYNTSEYYYGEFLLDSFTSDVDTDGDGFLDSVDACPNSDLSPTVVIDGCDSGVENDLLDDGCTISDLIAACAATATNHGEFVSCVADLTNQLKTDGVITGKEKGGIQSCAAKSSIGK